MNYYQDEEFNTLDFTQKELPKGEYENCTFSNCNFSGCDLSHYRFMDCEFIDCDLSMIKLRGTLLQDIRFKDSKMLGVRFDQCDDFGLRFFFEGCQLNHASFYQLKCKNTIFRGTLLKEADFTETDLTKTLFDNCDLFGATFESTILEQTDLRKTQNLEIDPDKNRMRKARISVSALPGLLRKYNLDIEL